MKSLHSQNFYEILGVSRYAAPEEIRHAYELSKQTFTQDSMATYSLFSEEEHEEILDLIGTAYETLLNPDLRREYDTFLDSGAPGSHTAWNAWRRPRTERTGEPQRRAPPRSASTATARRAAGKPPPADPPPRPRGERDPAEPASPHPARQEPQAPPEPVSARPQGDAPSADPDPGTDMERFADSVEAFDGPTLRKARELRGLSLREVCDQTKIRQTYVEYIETENFGGLPAAVYVKGFVKLLASTLDLPTDRVVEDYMGRYEQR